MGTVTHLTQRDRARLAYARLLVAPLDKEAVDELRRALGEAQNPPPEGVADGSLDELTWATLQRSLTALTMLQHAHDTLTEIKRDPVEAGRRFERAAKRRRDEDWG